MTNYAQITRKFSQELSPPDLIVTDKDDQIILLVKVKAGLLDKLDREELFKVLSGFKPPIGFGMLADSQIIEIFQNQTNSQPLLIKTLSTATILSHYEPNFNSKPIYITYLISLIGAWLRDFAYHWHSEYPPAWQEMAEIGLLTRFSEGTTEEF